MFCGGVLGGFLFLFFCGVDCCFLFAFVVFLGVGLFLVVFLGGVGLFVGGGFFVFACGKFTRVLSRSKKTLTYGNNLGYSFIGLK